MLEKAKTKASALDSMTPYEAKTVKPGRVRVLVEGYSPLLTHNPESMGISPEAMKGGRIPLPEVEAEAGVYRLEDGACALKGEAFRGALLNASTAYRMKKTSARSRLAHIVVEEELVPLTTHDGKPITSYVIDARRAIVQRQGIIRHRPRFNEWRCLLTFEYDPELIAEPKFIVDVLADAGRRIGVGDYRPLRNGWFGRFIIIAYEIL